MTAPALSPADVYPIRQARFVNGRTWHRVKAPVEWHDLPKRPAGKPVTKPAGTPRTASANAPHAPRPSPERPVPH